jgi:hypothetical protein
MSILFKTYSVYKAALRFNNDVLDLVAKATLLLYKYEYSRLLSWVLLISAPGSF